jgi:Na+/H+ antiporter NhaC
MLKKRDLKRAMRHGERELRAAGGDMLGQLRPKNIVRDAWDLALKFGRDDVLQAYIAPRIWKILPIILVFVLVSTVCAIDIMFRAGRFMPGIFALLVGAGVWTGGVVGQIYVFAILLEGRAAQRDREERGIHVDMPEGFLAYLKYSRALVPWIAVVVCVVFPLLVMGRYVPLMALGLAVAAAGAPWLFGKLDS